MNATISKKAQKQQEREEGCKYILSLLEGQEKPIAYTVIRGVSSSGMSRQISVKVIKEDKLYDISFSVAKVLDYPIVQKAYNAVKVNGCGMDMGFHIVSSLSSVLYGDDYKIRQEWA
jgi:uncharacterized protein YhbP (UPF0306 family)